MLLEMLVKLVWVKGECKGDPKGKNRDGMHLALPARLMGQGSMGQGKNKYCRRVEDPGWEHLKLKTGWGRKRNSTSASWF